MVIAAGWSGPLPHPQDLSAYKDISPDFPDRIMAMAEREQAHRHRRVGHDIAGKYLGLVFAFLIAALFVGFGWDLIRNGHSVAGTIFGGITLVWVVHAFFHGRSARRPRSKSVSASGRDLGNPPVVPGVLGIRHVARWREPRRGCGGRGGMRAVAAGVACRMPIFFLCGAVMVVQ